MTTTVPAGSPVTAPLAVIFAVNDGLITRALEGLSEDELWTRTSERTNPMFWLYGHIVHTRGALLRALGDDFRTGWGDKFQRGAVLLPRDAYPNQAEIGQLRGESSARIQARLAALTDEQLNAPPTATLPAVKNMADQIAFLAFHEAYHVGQLGLLRKMLGHAGIAG
jgi:uncharacterized damage-inducible protein DinB